MSTTTGLESQAHPIARFSARLHHSLDGLAASPAWSMTADEQRSALVELARAEARLTELRLRVLAAADHADVAQARVVVQAVSRLPESVVGHDRERAEKHLLLLAGEFDAQALKTLGRRVFETIDPEAADLEEGRRLEAEERAAARATYLHLTDNGDGTQSGRFKISTLHGAMLTKMLHALAAPRRRDPELDRSRLTRPELMGAAFCRLLERFPSSRLPRAGGVSATVVVLLDYDRLVSGLGAAQLDTGEAISAARARLLACESGVIPAVYRKVLGGPSVVLDQGRRRRFHDQSQRIALTVRDRGCSTEGCDRPAGCCVPSTTARRTRRPMS